MLIERRSIKEIVDVKPNSIIKSLRKLSNVLEIVQRINMLRINYPIFNIITAHALKPLSMF